MQAMVDFLTDETGLHNGTIKEGITEKEKKLVNLIFYLSNLKMLIFFKKKVAVTCRFQI